MNLKRINKKYGFQLQFSKAFQYIFTNKHQANQAMKQIREGLRQAGLTRADFYIKEKRGIRKGRGLRVLKGGCRA